MTDPRQFKYHRISEVHVPDLSLLISEYQERAFIGKMRRFIIVGAGASWFTLKKNSLSHFAPGVALAIGALTAVVYKETNKEIDRKIRIRGNLIELDSNSPEGSWIRGTAIRYLDEIINRGYTTPNNKGEFVFVSGSRLVMGISPSHKAKVLEHG